VANGGTGVTTSSGANSVVLRDASSNITANALDDGYINTVASGTPIVLTVSSVRRYTITGSGGQTIKLPDATTLVNGTVFQFDNNQSSGAITVNNNSNTLVVSVPSGGFVLVNLLSNSIAAGSWDRHDQAPSNVSWSTNTFDYAGSITSATWNGNTVAVNRGGTGASTLTGYVKGNGTSAMTASATIPSGDVSGLGTMATQNANAVAITGGTIDNTVIGGTTPAAGTFTTITGQTEVLKGTGSNLVLYSQLFSNAVWAKDGCTISGTLVTAPDGTTTGSTLVENSSTGFHRLYQAVSVIVGNTYTFSVDVAPNGRNWVYLGFTGGSQLYAYFNVSTGATGTVDASYISSSITLLSNGYYRCSVTAKATATTSYAEFGGASANGTYSYAGSNSNALNIWGSQLEVGTSLNTYIPTTTTAVYGTPTLSFSGVAGLGLESNGSLYVSPAGTGALQAQATTSSTVGGNARGANAVDWQTLRDAASKVASGAYSVVTGGYGNQSTGQYAINLGGAFNNSNSTYTGIYGGTNNTASLPFASVVNGSANTAAGYFNFIGAGFTNSGTSSSAVTTQSGTMNATTAVTLSGSNASIKVGQYITGTSIAGDTYVAAISGTSLTLSKVASSSSTSTLSFYTPHGVVVGGGNNQATGSYSFIGGGGDAGTAANRNSVASDWGVAVGGFKNTVSATGICNTIGGGYGNTISGGNYGSVIAGGGTYNGGSSPNTITNSAAVISGGISNNNSSFVGFIGGGFSNQASGSSYATIVGGQNNLSNSSYSFISAGNYGTTRGIEGNHVFPACNAPIAGSAGVSQTGLLILGTQTTDATATALRSNTSAASGTNQVILPNNSAYFFRGEVVSGVTGGGDTKGWTIEGVIKRGAGVGTTTLVGVTVTSMYADLGAATWTIGVTADTTNGGLAVTFTGQASTTIRTVCQIRTTEMTY
jgi:hypothetical protein